MPRQWPIAQEGFPFLAISLAAALISALVSWHWIAYCFCALAAFIAFFFRNPERHPPTGEGNIVSPADGRVLSIVDVDHSPHGDGPAVKVSIFMSVLNVHINRMPIAATVRKVDYRPGRFLVASLDKASSDNERNTLVVEDAQGRLMSIVQIAGIVARRIVCYARAGDQFDQGARLGLIRFGSRVELFIPRPSEISVKAGARVRAGETIIGRWA